MQRSRDRSTARFFKEIGDAWRAYREYTNCWEAMTYEERDQQRQHDDEMEQAAVSATAEREEYYLAMVKMAEGYVRADGDPEYLLDCTLLFVRTKRRSLKGRMTRLRSFGNMTNSRARMLHLIMTPDAKALFAEFKRLADVGRIIMLSTYGGKPVNGDEEVIELLERANANMAFADVYDDDDDDLDDGLGTANNSLLASTAN